MSIDDLKQALAQLKTDAHRLAEDELDQRGDSAERYRQARLLNDRLTALRSRVDATPSVDRALLDDTWRAAQRDLIFLLAQAPSSDLSGDLTSLAHHLSNEAIDLAKALFTAGAGDKAGYQQRAEALRKRLHELLAREGIREPDAERALSDAKLDIDYVARGGAGLISIHLSQVLRDLQRK